MIPFIFALHNNIENLMSCTYLEKRGKGEKGGEGRREMRS